MKFETRLEAVKHWVRGFNAIPQTVVVKAVENRNDQGLEGFFFDEVSLLASPQVVCGNCGQELYLSDVGDDGLCDSCGAHEWSPSYEMPMWGTMWTFDDFTDEIWARDNADKLAECGFTVFDHDDLGVFIGINGAGYDFYEAHWTPLYDARGLKWHKETEGL